MGASFLLGIDAGTTVIKSTLFTLDGREVAGAAHDSSLLVPRPGWAEADMDVVWQAVVATVQQALRRAAVAAGGRACRRRHRAGRRHLAGGRRRPPRAPRHPLV